MHHFNYRNYKVPLLRRGRVPNKAITSRREALHVEELSSLCHLCDIPPKRKTATKTAAKKTKSGAAGGVSECWVCSTYIVDDKNDALFCEGECSGWMHRYCVGIPLKHFERLTSTTSLFTLFHCYSCALQAHERDTVALKEQMKLLAEELNDLWNFILSVGDKDRATKGAVLVNVNNVGAGVRQSEVNGGDIGRGGVSTMPKSKKGAGRGRRGKGSGRRMGGQGPNNSRHKSTDCSKSRSTTTASVKSGARQIVTRARCILGSVKLSSHYSVRNTCLTKQLVQATKKKRSKLYQGSRKAVLGPLLFLLYVARESVTSSSVPWNKNGSLCWWCVNLQEYPLTTGLQHPAEWRGSNFKLVWKNRAFNASKYISRW